MEALQPKLRFPEFYGSWESHKLEDLTTKIGDGLHGTPEYIDNSDVYFINGNNLIDGKIVINENSKKVSVETLKKNDKGLDENSILISINGTIGSISRYSNEKIMLGKSVGYFNFKQSKEFYFHILQSNKIQDYFISELTGSTIKNLSLKTLRETTIYQPSTEEQTKIANFLSAVDEKINLLKDKKSLLEEYKKGIMQKIFNQEIRFKDDNGNDFEDWIDTKLGDFAKITTGSSNREDSNLDGEYTFFDRSQDIRLSNRFLFDAEAIIVPGEGQEFIPKYFKGKFDLHQRTYAIMDFGDNNGIFLFYSITFNKNHLNSHAVGSTVKSLRLPMFTSMPIKIPNIQEQTKIANFLSSIDEKTEFINTQLQDTQEYKKGLLQQMFV